MKYLLLVMPVLVGGLLFGRLAAAPPAEVEMAGFATGLRGRTRSQRHNAEMAVRQLDGAVIPAGGEFSFNRRVHAWSGDMGYVKAPVSFDGEMIRAYGGGVCQTSTTLYNAALLAGLPILERHSHVYVAHYAEPGRDAAVAQPSIDLRFKNPYRWPIRIRARAKDDVLEIRMFGAEKSRQTIQIVTDVLDRVSPMRITRASHSMINDRAIKRNPGTAGCRSITYRIFENLDGTSHRERLSDDTYGAMNRVVITSGD